jgi:hypothetical protein
MNSTKTVNSQHQTHTEICPSDVARRADQIWEAAGCPNGQDLDHWLQAETELLTASQLPRVNNGSSESDSPTPKAPAKQKAPTVFAARRKNGSKLIAGSREESGSRLAAAISR